MNVLIVFLIINTASAAILAQFHSSLEGSSEQRFEITKTQAQYVKRSNFFDKNKSLILGNFDLPKSQISEEDIKQIEAVLSKVEAVDSFLKKKKLSFNDYSNNNPHDSFFQLNGFRITKASDAYPELKKIFDRLQTYAWKENSAIKISEDYKQVTLIKDGKEISKENFDFAFYCRKPQPPTVCSYKDFGILYIH